MGDNFVPNGLCSRMKGADAPALLQGRTIVEDRLTRGRIRLHVKKTKEAAADVDKAGADRPMNLRVTTLSEMVADKNFVFKGPDIFPSLRARAPLGSRINSS
jgi:hypothetical protein